MARGLRLIERDRMLCAHYITCKLESRGILFVRQGLPRLRLLGELKASARRPRSVKRSTSCSSISGQQKSNVHIEKSGIKCFWTPRVGKCLHPLVSGAKALRGSENVDTIGEAKWWLVIELVAFLWAKLVRFVRSEANARASSTHVQMFFSASIMGHQVNSSTIVSESTIFWIDKTFVSQITSTLVRAFISC